MPRVKCRALCLQLALNRDYTHGSSFLAFLVDCRQLLPNRVMSELPVRTGTTGSGMVTSPYFQHSGQVLRRDFITAVNDDLLVYVLLLEQAPAKEFPTLAHEVAHVSGRKLCVSFGMEVISS